MVCSFSAWQIYFSVPPSLARVSVLFSAPFLLQQRCFSLISPQWLCIRPIFKLLQRSGLPSFLAKSGLDLPFRKDLWWLVSSRWDMVMPPVRNPWLLCCLRTHSCVSMPACIQNLLTSMINCIFWDFPISFWFWSTGKERQQTKSRCVFTGSTGGTVQALMLPLVLVVLKRRWILCCFVFSSTTPAGPPCFNCTNSKLS